MMKQIFLGLIGLILMVAGATAINQPSPALPFYSIDQPPSPSTGTATSGSYGTCSNYWQIKDEYCSGNIHHYTQCIKTITGGVWQPKSEDCTEWFNGACVGTTCKPNTTPTITVPGKPPENPSNINYTTLILIGVVILIIYLIYKGRKK